MKITIKYKEKMGYHFFPGNNRNMGKNGSPFFLYLIFYKKNVIIIIEKLKKENFFMWYGYRVNDQQDWIKIKTFDSLNEYKDYIAKHRITISMCSNKEIDLRGKALITYENNAIRGNPYAELGKSK